MLGQVFNKTAYNRRLSVLNALMKEHKSEQMLKEKASIFPESHEELLGQSFSEDWCTNLKTKQKHQEVLRKKTKSTPKIFRNRPLVRRGSAISIYGRVDGGRTPQAFFVRTMPQTQRQHGKSSEITLPQHSTTSECRLVKTTSLGSGCEYFIRCAGFQNFFLPNPISVWSYPISLCESREKVTNKFRNKGNVEERCNSTGEIRIWGISKQFVLSKQEGWRSSPCNKSHISE